MEFNAVNAETFKLSKISRGPVTVGAMGARKPNDF